MWRERCPFTARAAEGEERKWCLVVENKHSGNDQSQKKRAAYHLGFISREHAVPDDATNSLHVTFPDLNGEYSMCTLTCNLHKTCVLSPLGLWSISQFSGDIHTTFIFTCRHLPAFSLKPLLITSPWASPVFYYWKWNWGINSQDCDTPQCAAFTVCTPVSVLHSYGTVAVHA